jgi:RsiW-degrading membrane proteinase PrsW (M82 family)
MVPSIIVSFVEELMKVLPQLMLRKVPLFKRQWSFADLVLIAAATGAGFGLAENLYRFGTASDHAQSITPAWTLVFSQGYLLVSSIGRVLTSWLPVGVSGPRDLARLNLHLVWSAVAGLAVGLTVFKRTAGARLTALGLYVCISLDYRTVRAGAAGFGPPPWSREQEGQQVSLRSSPANIPEDA